VTDPTEITREAVDAAVRAVGGEREQRWESSSEERKAAYVQRLRQGASEPAELSVLLADPDAAERWAGLPWLLRAEYVAWINAARTGFMRRRRAAFAVKSEAAPTPSDG
jgi:hypothetical protein